MNNSVSILGTNDEGGFIMYEERKEKFSFKSFFLTLLLVLLFIFLMLWLFPTKSYVNEKLQSTYDLERLSVLYDEIFANNVARM